MVLKFFLVYIGIFLSCSVVLVVLAKNFSEGIAAGGKKPVLQGGFSAVVASGTAYLATLFTAHLFLIYWVFAGVFLLLGLIHVLFFHRRYFYSNDQNRRKVLLAEVLFMLAVLFFIIVVFSSLEYFLRNRDFLFFPMMMSMIAFFVPLLVFHTFEAAFAIPASIFPVWQYPLDQPIELPDEKPNEKILVIAFELCKKPGDSRPTNFRARAPETMKLGDLYYHFLNDYNEVQSETPIQYADGAITSHQWGFRIKPKWYQSHRIIDPELTVRENKVVENTVIICERL